MTAQRTTREYWVAVPGVLRAVISVALIIGVLAMHHMTLESADGTTDSHDMTLASHVFHAGEASTAVLTKVTHPDLGAGAASDCGGLMMLCMAMMLGISGYIVLRKRQSDRILWQLPPPLRLERFAVIDPFEARSPLQRSSVLRC